MGADYSSMEEVASMIYTITFNPAVDVVIRVENLQFGGINRTSSQEIYYGGKGINVSYVLRNLGRQSTAWGFLAGNIGSAMKGALEADGLGCDFIMLPEGETRINTKLRTPDEGGSLDETAFNASGPAIDEKALDLLFAKLESTVDGDVLIVSGGVPSNLGSSVYARLLETQAGKDVRVVVDATGDLLLNTLPHKPFLIKPNDEELAEIAGCDPEDRERLIEAAEELHERGAVNVLVSRGGKGALLIDENGVLHEMDVLKGELVNSVGAGDSTVAGFVHGYLEAVEGDMPADEVYGHAFAMAMACGAATAFSPGLAAKEDVERLLEQI